MCVDQDVREFVLGQEQVYARWESLKWTHLRARISEAISPRARIPSGRVTAVLLAFVFTWLACASSASALDLYWVNTSSTADGIQVERATSSGGPWSQIATVGGSATNYPDNEVSCGTDYYYRVRAYNSAGQSPYSNVAGPSSDVCCNYALTSPSASYSSSGGSGTINVTAADTSCAWTATSLDSWITITAGASGAGNGTVSYSVAANTSSSTLTSTVIIAGQVFTVTEGGVACSYSLSSASASRSSSAGSGSVNVIAPGGCAWSVSNTNSWITITGGSSGTGNGTVSYSVSANASGATRSGVVIIGGQSYTVTQTSSACAYTLSSTSASYNSSGGSGTVNVTAGSSCGWTAASNAGWITITAGASGTGNGTVSYSVAANASSSTLTGTVTIGGQTFTVTEGGIACSYSLSSTSASYTFSGGSGSVNVTAGSSCAWTAASNIGWITVTGGSSGSGNGTVSYSVAANTGSSTLTGTVTIAGQTFTVTEAGVACSYSLSSASASYSSSGGSGSVNVTAPGGCAWTVNNTNSWISVTGGSSGTGNGTVSYSVSANASGATRSGVVIIGGQSYTVTQTSSACTYTLSSTSASYTSSGGSGAVDVTAGSSCAWTAASNAGWITITAGSSGTGNSTVSYSVAANTSSSTLTGTVTIAGQTFTVIEAGVSCAYTLSSSARVFSYNGGTYSVSVTSPSGCAWTVNNTNSWITITGGGSGTDTGTVNYSVSANTGLARSGKIVIGGQIHSVTQFSGACTYTVSSTSASYTSSGGSGSVNVTGGSGCAWTATSNVGWITVTAGASGTGNGTVSYSVAANTSSSELTGTVTIAGQTFTVIEAGAPCTYTLSSTKARHSSKGGNGSVNVKAPAGCAWTAVSNDGWITITSGSSGTGDGTVSYTAATVPSLSSISTSSSTLTGTVTIAGQTFTVVESASMSDEHVVITNAVDTANGLPLVLAGEEVGFSVDPTNDDQGPFTYLWDFGDGSGSTDSIPVHVFTNCGTYIVTVAISDGQDTTNADLTVAVPCAMSVTNFQATLNFAKPNQDKCTFKAVPQPGQCTNWLGTVITIGVGDAQVSFTLDAKGRGVSTNGTGRFTYNKKTGTCTFTANLNHGNWRNSWAPYGLVNATILKPGSQVTLPVTLIIGNSAFMAEKPLHYIATANKQGKAK